MMPPHTTILGKLHLYKPERAANVALTAPAPESDLTAAIVAERLGRAAPKPHSSTDKKNSLVGFGWLGIFFALGSGYFVPRFVPRLC